MKKRFPVTKLLIIIILTILAYFLPLPITNEAKLVFSILVLAAGLWVTETIPLFLTSLVITILVVLVKVYTFENAVIKFFNPILALFFGGFLIGRAMQNVELDKRIATQITAKFATKKTALLALMFVTAFLSMWMMNTTTTVVMIPIALGIVYKFTKKLDNFTKASVLAIAYSANIGGIGTLLGSTPNAIAVAQLASMAGIKVTFWDWMKAALPIVIILVPVAWYVLIKLFPFKNDKIKHNSKVKKQTREQKMFTVVFLATILLWITTNLHGLSASLIALISAVVLFLIGLLKPLDLNKINYQVLLLFGGGLVLGSAMFDTGLSEFFAVNLAGLLQGYPDFIIMLGVMFIGIAIAAFASNTATAAILVPIILSLADLLQLSARTLGLLLGIVISFCYLLPVGTPPNAIAYATGKIRIKDMLKAGVVLTIVSVLVLALWARFVW